MRRLTASSNRARALAHGPRTPYSPRPLATTQMQNAPSSSRPLRRILCRRVLLCRAALSARHSHPQHCPGQDGTAVQTSVQVSARARCKTYMYIPGLMSAMESSDEDEDDMEEHFAKKRRLTKGAPDSQREPSVVQTQRDVSTAQPRSRLNVSTKDSQADSNSTASKAKGKAKASSSGGTPSRPQAGSLARLAAASSGERVVSEGAPHAADTSYGGQCYRHTRKTLVARFAYHSFRWRHRRAILCEACRGQLCGTAHQYPEAGRLRQDERSGRGGLAGTGRGGGEGHALA